MAKIDDEFRKPRAARAWFARDEKPLIFQGRGQRVASSDGRTPAR